MSAAPASKKVWVPGGKGMLGAYVVGRLRELGCEVRATDLDVDITKAAAIDALLGEFAPTHIINCAAYTAVDKAESERDLAMAVNGTAVGNLAAAAKRQGALFAHVSTDYVFGGDAKTPYQPTDRTDPLGFYGQTKLRGEEALAQAFGNLEGSKAYILRTSWLFGPRGHNFVRTMLRLMKDKPELRVVDDQRGRPTYTHDLGDALLRATGLSGPALPGGIYHVANSEEVTWCGFATAILDAGKKRFALRCERVVPIRSDEYPTPTQRPAYSVLATEKYERAAGVTLRPWRAALADYLDWYEANPTER